MQRRHIFVCFAAFVGNQWGVTSDYQLVLLANGQQTLFSASYGEKLHPGLGPLAEAELLYVRQLQLCVRLRRAAGELVIWDVGLGGAANAIAALRALRDIPGQLRLVSFDNTSEPLAFALKHAAALQYPQGFETALATLLQDRQAVFSHGQLQVHWEFHLTDFPALLANLKLNVQSSKIPAPHAVFYDAFSPVKNPAMWTLPVFENLFQVLDPARPCALTTYSRSTLLRATLLRAGFYVGAGPASGRKEETTIAANSLDLITTPLDVRWLERAQRSSSAEPMREPVYTRAPLSLATAERLRLHPQFRPSGLPVGCSVSATP